MPSLVLLLGGKGIRFGKEKQFLTYEGKPLYEYILEEVKGLFNETILVVSEKYIEQFKELYPNFKIAPAGKERQFSVYNGLKFVTEDKVVIHDGVRPLAERKLFERVLNLENCDGKITAIPVRDTIKKVKPNGEILKTLNRNELVASQTPQGFKTDILKYCHGRALKENFLATDDAALLEHYGFKVCITEGSFKNIKITYPEDWELVKCLLKKKK
jgi:2-C-methyl-D-erythritol 4-phosphate cytidylyltransferase